LCYTRSQDSFNSQLVYTTVLHPLELMTFILLYHRVLTLQWISRISGLVETRDPGVIFFLLPLELTAA